MAKPFSFRTEPWVSLDKCADSIFSDDFVHDKLFTVKTTHISTKGTANLKATLSQSGDEFKVAEEIKLWFPVWSRGGSLYFKSKGKDLKILYDDGVSAWSLKELWSLNTYGSVQTNKNLRNVVLKAGANVITPEWVFGTRIRYGLNEESGSLSWGNKIHWAKGDWSVAAYDHVSLNSMSLLSNALRIGYTKDSNLFFLRAENNLSRSLKHLNLSNPDFYFTDFTADWLRNVDINTKAGVETSFTRLGVNNVSLVVARNFLLRNASWKLKVSSNKSLAFSYQTRTSDYGRWTLGAEVSDIGGKNGFRYGAQVDLNL